MAFSIQFDTMDGVVCKVLNCPLFSTFVLRFLFSDRFFAPLPLNIYNSFVQAPSCRLDVCVCELVPGFPSRNERKLNVHLNAIHVHVNVLRVNV